MEVLEAYLDGKLDAKTMNKVEREALEDPFVAEALHGLSQSPKRSLESISLLQKQLHKRIAAHETDKKVSVFTWQRLSTASAAAVLFIAVSIMFWMRHDQHQKELAGKGKKIEVTIAPNVPVTNEDSPVKSPAEPVLAKTTADHDQEIDKALIAAKINTYATRAKKKPSPIGNSTVKVAVPLVIMNSRMMKDSGQRATPEDALQNEAVAVNDATSRAIVQAADSNRMGIAAAGKVAVIAAVPIGGWDEFFEYIRINNAFAMEPKTGHTVELNFKIDQEGRPSDIKIVNDTQDRYEQEAIRLISKGPKWEKPQTPERRVTYKIDF